VDSWIISFGAIERNFLLFRQRIVNLERLIHKRECITGDLPQKKLMQFATTLFVKKVECSSLYSELVYGCACSNLISFIIA